MKTILVTGVGAIIGYGIIKSLRELKYPVKIIGLDIFDDAVGKHWCDEFEQTIYTNNPDYPAFLRRVIKKYDVDLVIPGIEQDVQKFSEIVNDFKDLKAKFVLNNTNLIKTSDDKWLTHLELQKHGIPTIKTVIEGDFFSLKQKLGLPMIIKPRSSYACKDLYQVDGEEEFLYVKNKLKDRFMAQELVGDDDSEYTVGVFCTEEGFNHNRIALKRKLSHEAATQKAEVVTDGDLNKVIDKLISIFKPIGPTNFQFRKHNGEFLLLEINPRISSSTSIRTAFGYNEAEMCIEYFLENKVPEKRTIKKGKATRFIEDYIEYDCDNI